MKKVKCLVLKSFKDSENNEMEIKCNSEYICSEERANKLSLLRYVSILEDASVDDVEESTEENNSDTSSDVDNETSTTDNEESNLEDDKESTEGNTDIEIETASLIDKTKTKNARK